MKISLAILSISLACQACFGQATNIDGLFGIKLGQPLPASCTNSQTTFKHPDEWGFQVVDELTPPAPNSEFTNFYCYAKLTPTNHLVCEVDIHEDGMDSSAYAGVLSVLRNHYGRENDPKSSNVDGMDNRMWLVNHRRLIFAYIPSGSTQIVLLMCDDEPLSSHPEHVTDTNGL